MDTKQFVLEAAHSYTIYTALVPQGRLLKWADVMLYAVEAIEAKDEKIKEQCTQLFRAELERLVFEPIYVLTKAVATNLPREEKNVEVGAKIEQHRQNILKVVKSVKESMDGAVQPDLIALKYKLIDALNECFAYLNKVQNFQYPEIKHSSDIMPEALKKNADSSIH